VCFCKGLVCIFVCFCVDHFGFCVAVSFVGFTLFRTEPTDWLGRSSPK